MKCVIQRVQSASVLIDGAVVSKIGPGLLTLLGVAKGDTEDSVKKMIQKICHLRIFEDDAGKMNLSLLDRAREHLIISQFTLLADCSSGRRPSFVGAEAPERARDLYEHALDLSRLMGVSTASGVFQADMKVTLVNDGPVTIVLES